MNIEFKFFETFISFFTNFADQTVSFFSNLGSVTGDKIMQVLEVMGMGLLGIFAVTLLIIGVVTLLNKTTNKEKKAKKE